MCTRIKQLPSKGHHRARAHTGHNCTPNCCYGSVTSHHKWKVQREHSYRNHRGLSWALCTPIVLKFQPENQKTCWVHRTHTKLTLQWHLRSIRARWSECPPLSLIVGGTHCTVFVVRALEHLHEVRSSLLSKLFLVLIHSSSHHKVSGTVSRKQSVVGYYHTSYWWLCFVCMTQL